MGALGTGMDTVLIVMLLGMVGLAVALIIFVVYFLLGILRQGGQQQSGNSSIETG